MRECIVRHERLATIFLDTSVTYLCVRAFNGTWPLTFHDSMVTLVSDSVFFFLTPHSNLLPTSNRLIGLQARSAAYIDNVVSFPNESFSQYFNIRSHLYEVEVYLSVQSSIH